VSNLKIGWLAAGALAIAIIVVAGLVYKRFRCEIRTAQERVNNGSNRVVDTDCGPIEYAEIGEGAPVLVVHGIFGGFDQGLVIARGNVGEQFRSIVPSRFGYLGTPLPNDASSGGQADAHACLLDVLGIDQAAIIGTSAGGTSAIQFCLRHPDRCTALVLFSSNLPGKTEAALPLESMARAFFKSDFLFWLATTYFSSSLRSTMGVPDGFELTPEHEADVAELMKTILPVKQRSEGALFDMFVSNPDINSGYPLEEITVPVLIVNAVDDPLALYENARSAGERIPGAELVTIEDGGHMMLGHEMRIRSEIESFLEEHASTASSQATKKQRDETP
jgi:pimeloyl-ACP methyl ester carboxylesterase